jgi:hypothetical protein
LDFDPILAFPDFDLTADPSCGHRVTVGLYRHITFDIDDTVMKPVYIRHPHGQRL